MDKAGLDRILKMLDAPNDADAVMGLRALQGLLREKGQDLGAVVAAALGIAAAPVVEAAKTAPAIAEPARPPARVEMSGMPQCRAPAAGSLEIIAPGKTEGERVALTGAAAAESEAIAGNLKDALVAAVINKSRFKLKLQDIKNGRGETVETILQAEYEREGMTPIRVWVNATRGEVASLAAVLRKAVANSLPELVAA